MRRTVGTLLLGALVAAGCVSAGTSDAEQSEAIEVFGPWEGPEADRFAAVLAEFEQSSGIEVRYVGSVDFVDDLTRRTGEGNDPPDVAAVPQVGLIRQLADDERIIALPDDVATVVDDAFAGAIAEIGRIDDLQWAIPFRLNVKSIVWYRPDVFEEYGWTPPSTMADLEALADRIQADSDLAPWCFGMEAGSATGWAATDWVEDLLLRSAGPVVYDDWANGEIDFDSPEVEAAFEQFRSLVLAPGRVAGGTSAVVETPVADSITPLFADPPVCAMHRQADFAIAWMPDDTTIGPEGTVDFFLLPGTSGAAPPVVLGGDQMVQFRDDPAVNQLMIYLASPEAAEVWATEGGFIGAHAGIPDTAYADEYVSAIADALADAPSLDFDASDQMPASIGSGLYWDLITEWVLGLISYDELATELDDAYAALTPAASGS